MTAPRGTETGTGSGSTGSPDARWGGPPPPAGEVTAGGWTPRAANPQPDQLAGPPAEASGANPLEEATAQLTQRRAAGAEGPASSAPGAGAGTTADAPERVEPTGASRPGESGSTAGPGAAGSGRPPAPEATERASEPTTVLPGGPAAGGVRRPPPARPAPPRPGPPRSDARPAAPRPGPGRTRRARLALRRIDPWSVFVFSLIASMFVGVALVVAVAVLYSVLGSLGVTQSLNQLFAEVTGGSASGAPLLTGNRIIGGAAVLAAVNVVFLTLLATLASLLYNLCASFTGGIELTLGERD